MVDQLLQDLFRIDAECDLPFDPVGDGELRTLDTAAVTLSPVSSTTTGDLYLNAEMASQNAGRTLLIERDTDAIQGWEARYGDREVGMERQLDREVMAIQEVKRQMLTTLRGTTAMAAYQPEAGRVPTVNEDGTGWINGPQVADIYAAIDGVATLNVGLAAEGAARIAGDNSLLSLLSSEAASRIAGDNGLATRISGEGVSRAAGDTYLQSQISTIVGGSAITTENSFATQDAFVAWDAAASGKIAGMVIFANGLPYVYDGVSTAIPDLPGWVPGGIASVAAFNGDVSAALSYAGITAVDYGTSDWINDAGNGYYNLYGGGKYKTASLGRYQVGRYNVPVNDPRPVSTVVKFSNANRETDTAAWDQVGYFGLMKMSGNAYGAALTSSARSLGGSGDLVGVHGRATISADTGAVGFGGWFYATGGGADWSAEIHGMKIGIDNAGPAATWPPTPGKQTIGLGSGFITNR